MYVKVNDRALNS